MTPTRLRRSDRPLFLPLPPLFNRRLSSFPFFTSKTSRAWALTRVPCASLKPTNPATQYVPLHVHSDFSLLDGASQLPALVQRAESLGVPALALTDHGVLYGAIQLVRNCQNTSVKPIIGNEMYVVNDDLSPDREPRNPAPKRYHLIVLAKSTTGYRNLVKLTTMAHLTGKVGKGIFARPSINKAQLYEYREGLIVSSACLGGEIAQAILNDDICAARSVAKWFRDVFADDFYLEIQDHGSEEDKKVNPVMIQLSKELGINVIATNDSHFTSCLDAEAHDAMICIQTGKLLTDDNRLHYAGNEYFKSVDEMRQCFVDHLPLGAVDEALYNTIGVAAKVDKYDLFGATRIPDFPVPGELPNSHDGYLRYVARLGLTDRIQSRLRSGLIADGSTESYKTRLEEELDMICRMGFSSYFLVVWDYIKHAREIDIPVGPGRGSAAGSLVAFALRITDVDPIAFGLLFERFLNPERKSMPDIDTDFSVEGRERIINYVSERYGRDRVAQIITFNRLTSKAVLKDVARVHSVPYSEADRLAKLIPVVRGKPATLSKLLSIETPSPDFKRMIEKNPAYQGWLDKAQRIEGANKSYGVHAAGVVISASPLTDIVPLSRAKHGEIITQYAMEDVEALGLLKMDFLGLKNLTIIETALRFINEGRKCSGLKDNLDFSVDELPLDDPKTYKLLAEGELDGIFQLDASGGMRSIVRELRPSNLEDISSILALYRPGPLDAGLIPKFIRRKHGVDPIEYDHPLLEPILKETYGIMVYQEQIMRIARDLAGYSLGQADILRRAMGKKKAEDMEREKPIFIEGAKNNGVSEATATALFEQMLKFAQYCFNKSHSTAYAYLTYQTAYLKANYPVEYCAAVLRSNMNQSDKLVRYLADANALGVRVLPPSVNRSELGFTVDRTDKEEAVVLFGLEAVKTVGESVSKALLEEREANGPFLNVIELIERVDLRVLNKRAMGSLIQAGAFDELHPNRKVLLEQLNDLLVLRRKLRDKRKRREAKGMSDEDREVLDEQERISWEDAKMQLAAESRDCPDSTLLERLAGEKYTMGFYASGHPLYDLRDVTKMLECTPVSEIIGEQNESEVNVAIEGEGSVEGIGSAVPEGTDVMVLSCVTDLKRMTTAKGKKMAKWIIEDASARVPAIVFPGSYELMEQVVLSDLVDENASNVLDDSLDNNEVALNEEPRCVVQEDVRVIVWGRVSRESSGSTQVIVDDVQRVEDVNVVMITAPYEASVDVAVKVEILRHMAAKILDVDFDQSAPASYIDANGEIRRRRARKSVPLASKKRLPLILKYLDDHGNALSYWNLGNEVRFPSDCQEYMKRLEKNAGLEINLLSVGRDIMAIDVDDLSGGEIEALDVSSVDVESDLLDEQSGNLSGSHSLSVTDALSGSSTGVEQLVVDAESGPSYVGLTSSEGGDADQTEDGSEGSSVITTNRPDQILMDGGFGGELSQPVPETDITTDNDMSDVEVDGDVGNVISSRSEPDNYLLSSEDSKVSTASKDVMPIPAESADGGGILSGIRSKYRRDPFYTRTFVPIHGVDQFSAHDAFEMPLGEDKDSGLGKVTSKSLASVPASNARLETLVTDPSTKEMQKVNVEPVGRFGHRDDYDSIDKSFVGGSSSLEGVGAGADVELLKDTARRVVQSAVLEEKKVVNLKSNTVAKVHSVEDTGEVDIRIGIDEKEDGLSDELALGSGRGLRDQLADAVVDSQADEGLPEMEGKQMAYDMSDGLVVHFGKVKLAGVVDAIGVVASDVARKYGGGRHVLCGMSECSMEKICEGGVSIHVGGRVAFANGQKIYVIVDLRETEPSGKRKRVRSFGPVAVIMKAEDEVVTSSLKTKKAKKSVETFVQKVRKYCRDEEAADGDEEVREVDMLSKAPTTIPDPSSSSSFVGKKAANSIIHVRACDVDFATAVQLTDVGDGAILLDGGEMMSYMARAAEKCAERAVGELTSVSVMGMDWLVVPDAIVWSSVRHVCVRTHLEGLSFGTLKIQVEGEVTAEGETFKFMGVFGVCCGDGRLLKRMRLGVPDDDRDGDLFSTGDVLSYIFDEARQDLEKGLTTDC